MQLNVSKTNTIAITINNNSCLVNIAIVPRGEDGDEEFDEEFKEEFEMDLDYEFMDD